MSALFRCLWFSSKDKGIRQPWCNYSPPQPATVAQAQFIPETLLCFFSLYIMRSLRTNVTWNNCSESLTCFAIASSFAFSPTKHLGLLTDTFQKEYIATLPRSFRCVWLSMKKDRSQLIFGQQRLCVSSRRWWPDSVARVSSVFRVRGLFVPYLSDVLCAQWYPQARVGIVYLRLVSLVTAPRSRELHAPTKLCCRRHRRHPSFVYWVRTLEWLRPSGISTLGSAAVIRSSHNWHR